MAINTSHLPKLGQLQTAMTTTKTYIDGIAEAVDDALDEMDERIRGYVYDETTENLTIPSSFCSYSDENLTLY